MRPRHSPKWCLGLQDRVPRRAALSLQTHCHWCVGPRDAVIPKPPGQASLGLTGGLGPQGRGPSLSSPGPGPCTRFPSAGAPRICPLPSGSPGKCGRRRDREGLGSALRWSRREQETRGGVRAPGLSLGLCPGTQTLVAALLSVKVSRTQLFYQHRDHTGASRVWRKRETQGTPGAPEAQDGMGNEWSGARGLFRAQATPSPPALPSPLPGTVTHVAASVKAVAGRRLCQRPGASGQSTDGP